MIKDKLFRAFVTCFLRILGKKYPEFVEHLIEQNVSMPIHRKIIKARYIDGVKFECIPDFINYETSVRNVFKIHKLFIDKLIDYIISDKSNSL